MLEAAESQRQAEAQSLSPPASAPVGSETPDERAAVIAEIETTALDRQAPAGARLLALKLLRFRNGRTREVAAAMVEILGDPSLDASTRADIIRNLDGLRFEEMKAPLLHALQRDSDPKVRMEVTQRLLRYQFIAGFGNRPPR